MLKINRAALQTVLSSVNGIVPHRHHKDIFRCVLLKTVEDGAGPRLTLTANDGEISVVGTVKVESLSHPLHELVTSATLLSIIREVPADTVEIKKDGLNSLSITAGGSEFTLGLLDPDAFPEVATELTGGIVYANAVSVREALRRTVIATDTESTRYALGGVCFEFGGSSLTMVATDSRRLSIVDVATRVEGTSPDGRVVIPNKTLTLLTTVLNTAGENEEVAMTVAGPEAAFRFGGYTVRSRLVDGVFPKWQAVIPSDPTATLPIAANELLACVRQVQLMTSDENRGVDFKFAEGVLELSGKSQGIGSATAEMPASYSGDGMTIRFDPRYVGDPLKIAGMEPVEWNMRTADEQVLLKIGTNWRYVIMPLSRA